MNKAIGIIIAIVIIAGGIYFLVNRSANNSVVNVTGEQQENSGAQGRLVLAVTDAAINMSTISEINMDISKVDVHSNEAGWVTVSTAPHTYNLLALNAEHKSEILAQADAFQAGSYDQIRLTVDSVTVKTKAGATSEAKLPSGELKINTALLVNANSTSSVNLDFMADKSLHLTGSGKYIFAPVVKIETRSDADVGVDYDANKVTLSGGHVDDTSTVGMDVDGSVKENFEIKSDVKLNLDENDGIKVTL